MALKGNQLWKLRKKHGANYLYATPELLWRDCVKYFEWIMANPLTEQKAFAYKGEITKTHVTKIHAMTIGGLCLFLNIGKQTWFNYREREAFKDTVEKVEEIIYEQKFTGAAADLLNGNIIARDLGLMDQKTITHTGGLVNASIDMNITHDTTPQEASRIYQELIRNSKLED